MVDWRVARRIAAAVGGAPPMTELPGDLGELCTDAERRVVAYAKLEPVTPLPAPEAVDREAWSEANLRGMAGVLDPLTESVGPASGPLREPVRAAAGLVMGAEVGGMVGLLSQRVMGQYEVPPTDPDAPARLLFVAPNLAEAAERLEADPAQLLRWVAIHEVTHGVQFSAVPWLRAHVASMVTELAGSLEVRIDIRALGRLADREHLREVVDRLRADGLVGAFLGADRRQLLDRIQATMAMIEGHAEHVMDAAGVDVLPDLDKLREALGRRRRDRAPLMRVFERLLGLEMKMRQYETGKRFCDAVVEQAGIEALNRAWAGPEALPTWAELEAPETWLERV